MQALHLEPFGGLAGDMLLAALLDLGDPAFRLADLEALAGALVPGEARLAIESVRRGAFRATCLCVSTPESAHPPHRHLEDLLGLLERAPLSSRARERAARVLERIAEAEARVHGVEVAHVHFHEVGAVDTLIDVAGAALALERLGIERVSAAPPYVGGGRIHGAHGEMPVPAPGTAELLRGVPHLMGEGGERLTPTGAALLKELVDVFAPDPASGAFIAQAIGYGAGQRDPRTGPPNLVRAQLGAWQSGSGVERARAWLLECNLDDTTPEEIGFLLERLRHAGALEAWSQPLQMKKDRPGVLVAALVREEGRAALEALCFRHTATLGLRWSARERAELRRETLQVDLAADLGLEEPAPVRVVRRFVGGEGTPGALDLSPEHDDLAALARRTERPLRQLEAWAVSRARATVENSVENDTKQRS